MGVRFHVMKLYGRGWSLFLDQSVVQDRAHADQNTHRRPLAKALRSVPWPVVARQGDQHPAGPVARQHHLAQYRARDSIVWPFADQSTYRRPLTCWYFGAGQGDQHPAGPVARQYHLAQYRARDSIVWPLADQSTYRRPLTWWYFGAGQGDQHPAGPVARQHHFAQGPEPLSRGGQARPRRLPIRPRVHGRGRAEEPRGGQAVGRIVDG
jgi:hypothetical protein